MNKLKKISIFLQDRARHFWRFFVRQKNKFTEFRADMNAREQILFAKRLAILIKAGVSIIGALDILNKQASKGSGLVIDDLRARIERGQSLSEAMAARKKVFGHFCISIVGVGEASGTLAQSLEYMSNELKKKRELRRAIIGALVYPSFIVAATIVIVIILTVCVFPKILPIFTSFKSELPWSTKILIGASNGIQHHWINYFTFLLFFGAVWGLLMRTDLARRASDQLFLRFPLLGLMFRCYFIANFTRTLGLLLKSEISIIQALKIASGTMSNAVYRRAFEDIAAGVISGGTLSENMENDKLLFPPLVSQMVLVGELTGNLSSSLMYLSEIYEDEMNNITKNLAISIEPVLMILMGILVGFVAISIITPIYGITQSLR